MIVFLDSRPFPDWAAPGEDSFDAEALKRSLAVLHMTTGNPLDFLFFESDLRNLATRLSRVLGEYGLFERPIHLAGLSLGGTRALRPRIILERHGSEYGITPGAVAVVDAPLDIARVWRSEGSAIARDHHPVAELRALGNDRAWLITTCGARSGYQESSSPHTWSIVDDAELAEWFASMSEDVQ